MGLSAGHCALLLQSSQRCVLGKQPGLLGFLQSVSARHSTQVALSVSHTSRPAGHAPPQSTTPGAPALLAPATSAAPPFPLPVPPAAVPPAAVPPPLPAPPFSAPPALVPALLTAVPPLLLPPFTAEPPSAKSPPVFAPPFAVPPEPSAPPLPARPSPAESSPPHPETPVSPQAAAATRTQAKLGFFMHHPSFWAHSGHDRGAMKAPRQRTSELLSSLRDAPPIRQGVTIFLRFARLGPTDSDLGSCRRCRSRSLR